MSRHPHSPLDDQHLSQINSALSGLDIADARIQLAVAAGVDVAEAAKQVKDARATLIRIKNVYFPGE